MDRDEALVRANLPLVHHVVASIRSRLPRHVDADDLVSVALTGLLGAARSYDPSRRVPFEAYATTRMRGAITDELRRMDWAPRSVRAQGRRVEEVAERIAGQHGRIASVNEVAAAVGLNADEVARVWSDVHRATVLNYDAFISSDDGGALLPSDGPTPEESLLDLERHGYLRDAIRLLPERLRAVVVGYFLEQRPMQELAAELGITESRVSHMRAEALALLREALTTAESEADAPVPPAHGVAARRRAAYCSAVANASDYRARLSSQPVAVAVAVAVAN